MKVNYINMAKEPGKYDVECELARKMCGAKGAILIIFEGRDGYGFSAAIPAQVAEHIPLVLRDVANKIEQQINENKDKIP